MVILCSGKTPNDQRGLFEKDYMSPLLCLGEEVLPEGKTIKLLEACIQLLKLKHCNSFLKHGTASLLEFVIQRAGTVFNLQPSNVGGVDAR